MTAAKRILMLLDNPLKSDSRVEREMKALAEAGHQVTILATNEDPSLPVEEETGFYRVLRRMNTGFKTPYRKNYKASNEEIIALIEGLSFDVLHCHDYHMLILGASAKERLPGVVLVYDAHEYLRGAPLYQEAVGLANRVKAFIVWRRALKDEHKAIRAADKIITITSGIAARMQHDYGLAALPVVVRNIPPKIPFTKREHYFHDRFGIDRENKILLHLGTIYHTDRQLRQLFDVVRNTAKLTLVLMGNRPRFYEIKAQVEADPTLRNTIFFHDFIASEGITAFIAAADIGLAHIKIDWEGHRLGFTNRFLAYSFAGLPVICTRQEECVLLGDRYGHVEFYDTDSQASLQHAVESMLRNYRERILRIPRIREELSWESEVQKLLAMYKELA